MNTNEATAIFAELDAYTASLPVERSPYQLALLDELNAIGAEPEDSTRPKVVAETTSGNDRLPQGGKDGCAATDRARQCADQTTNSTIPTIPNPNSAKHSRITLKTNGTLISARGDATKAHGYSSIYTIAGQRPAGAANAGRAPTARKPRRKAAQLDVVARKKSWEGLKSKGRKDRLNDAEKLSAAVWHTAAAGGVAVSLNLGIRREGMLLNHEDPRRRMMQNLHRELSAAGLPHVPYAMVFEMAPKREGGRLHLHGVIDTSGLDQGDLKRLGAALCKAASRATGAIGGLRQLEMVDLHNAPGWADYLLKDATRTCRELEIDNPFMMNNLMRSEARAQFEHLRLSGRKLVEPSTRSVRKSAVKHRRKTKKAV